MTREEFLNRIYETIDYICNGKVERMDKTFTGHPHFFLLHTKEEFDEELNKLISNKESFDRYDFYYILNHMFKYELNQYDSHTYACFYKPIYLPLGFKVIDNKVYIIQVVDDHKDYKGMEVKTINGVSINKIFEEIDYIKCYASKDYFNILVEVSLINAEVLRSLPSIGNVDKIVLSDNTRNLEFDLNNMKDYSSTYVDDNYNIKIVDDTLIFTYSACKNEEKMKSTVEYIKTLEGINHYIVDLRGNSGGNSAINYYLTEYLKDKDTIVLSDERVFSSARMCLATFKRNGALIFGKKPGTPISCFGNCVLRKDYDDIEISIRGSVDYWYYDENLCCHGITKEKFDEEYKKNPRILDIVYGDVDIELEPTLEDILNNHDTVLEYTLNYIKNKNE